MAGSRSDNKKIIVHLVKKASKEAIRLGLMKVDVNESGANFVAEQILVAYELIEQAAEAELASGTLSKKKLLLTFAEKGLSIAKIGTDNKRARCAIAAGVLMVSAVKAVGTFVGTVETVGGMTPMLLMEAAEMVAEIYATDEACGVSVYIEEEYVNPLYHWLNVGVYRALGINY